MKIKKFKIRCHAISEIMGGNVGLTETQKTTFETLSKRRADYLANVPGVKPLSKNMEDEIADLIRKRDNPQLPAGAKTYVKKWLKDTLFKRDREWKIDKIEKGLQCEPEAIKLIGKVYNLDLYKNDEYFGQHEFIEGTPDMIHQMKVSEVLKKICRDAKCSWDLDTFPMFDDLIPDDKYEQQLQGYMIIAGCDEAALDYTLIDTPMPLVMKDLQKLYFQSGGKADEWDPNAYDSMMPNYRFDDIPDYLRVKTFMFKKDPAFENKVIERVKMCRDYLAVLLQDEKVQRLLSEAA